MTIRQPTKNRPRPDNTAPPARDEAEYAHTCPDCKLCHENGYRLGRTRGRIDAWQEWTGHAIPGADPVLIGWPDVWAAIRRLIRKAIRHG